MATTTPNYGWPVPTSTDYVKDGATAIEALGDAIDATVFGLPKGLTLLSTTTLSGASTTVSGISQAYSDLEIWVYGMTNATGNSGPNFRPNATANLIQAAGTSNVNGTLALVGVNSANIQTANSGLRTDANNAVRICINNYASTTNRKNIDYVMSFASTTSTPITEQYVGIIQTNSAITSMEFVNGGGNWSTGTVKIFGM